MKRYFFLLLFLLYLPGCSRVPMGKAICNCNEAGSVAIYTFNTKNLSQADTACVTIQAQLPPGDSCHAFIND